MCVFSPLTEIKDIKQGCYGDGYGVHETFQRVAVVVEKKKYHCNSYNGYFTTCINRHRSEHCLGYNMSLKMAP